MGFTVVGPDHFLGSGHGEQRRESLHPPVDGDVVDVDAALGEQFFDVAVGQPKRRYQRTASTMTSGGNGSRRRRIVLREQDEGGEFSCRQSCCSDADAADAAVPVEVITSWRSRRQ
jgi:hypothetical protein